MLRLKNIISRPFSSTVTSKLQKRRERFIAVNFPEYAPNTRMDKEGTKRGRRLGGLFSDPTRAIRKLDGSEMFYSDNEHKSDLHAKLVRQIAELSETKDVTSSSTSITNTIQEGHHTLEELDLAKEPVWEKRRRHVRKLASIDYSSVGSNMVPRKMRPQSKNLSKHKLLPQTLGDTVDSVSPEYGVAPVAVPNMSLYPVLPVTTKYVEYQGTATPSVVTSTAEEYSLATRDAVAFSVSYSQIMDFSGLDALLTLDHFVTGPIRLMEVGNCLDAAIVDTKGYVLTTCVVTRTSATQYRIITPGNSAETVLRYISQFVVYSRQTGLAVTMNPSRHEMHELWGPQSVERIIELLNKVNDVQVCMGQKQLPALSYLTAQPVMSSLSASVCVTTNPHTPSFMHIMRLGQTRYWLLFENDPSVWDLSSVVPLGGVYALDILRMEQRIPRAGIDIPVGKHSPVRASLSGQIDLKKVREKVLFGHVRIAKDLLKGTTHKRVMLSADKYVYPGCRVLSLPHRLVVGEITSCVWSFKDKKRICQAQLKREYCVTGTCVAVNVPSAIPTFVNRKFQQRIVKQGNLQNVFRKLVPASVIDTICR